MIFSTGAPRHNPAKEANVSTLAIKAIAKEYVETHIRVQRGEIEEAFRKMMVGSGNRIVKAFGKAVENALEEDWAFDLKVAVEHKEGSGSDDSDD